jgi:hypothetical protein
MLLQCCGELFPWGWRLMLTVSVLVGAVPTSLKEAIVQQYGTFTLFNHMSGLQQ